MSNEYSEFIADVQAPQSKETRKRTQSSVQSESDSTIDLFDALEQRGAVAQRQRSAQSTATPVNSVGSKPVASHRQPPAPKPRYRREVATPPPVSASRESVPAKPVVDPNKKTYRNPESAYKGKRKFSSGFKGTDRPLTTSTVVGAASFRSRLGAKTAGPTHRGSRPNTPSATPRAQLPSPDTVIVGEGTSQPRATKAALVRGSALEALPFSGTTLDLNVLLDIIAEDSGDNYDAWSQATKSVYTRCVKIGKPTELSIGEILLAADTGKCSAACGRYQFIPQTLRGIVMKYEEVKRAGITLQTVFSPKVQDAICRMHAVRTMKGKHKQFNLDGNGRVIHPLPRHYAPAALGTLLGGNSVTAAYNRLAAEWMIFAAVKDGKFTSTYGAGNNKSKAKASSRLLSSLVESSTAQLSGEELLAYGGRYEPLGV